MPPSTLLDNLNSDLFAAFSALLPKGAAQRVLVYVESDDDIAFWKVILTPFETNDIIFDVQLPVKNALEKGKLAVLEFADRVGSHLILCVDSDYDYLLQATTPTSALINSNEFIFQTYTYSIENLLCYAHSLHRICVQSSKNDTRIIAFDALLKLYSKIIYPLFLWSIYYALKQDTTSFTLTTFCDTIKILEKAIVSEQFSTALNGLKNRVDAKVQELEGKFPNDKPHVAALIQELNQLGVEDTNVYLFTQGHTIKDNVVIIFLRKVVDELSTQKYAQINQILDNKVKNDQRNHYKNQIIPIELALNTNTEYKSCFLYHKIHADLSQYVQRF
jgi:Protein of unknown function (DUF4435)